MGLATLDALGVFVMGTYYSYKDNGELNTDSSIIMEFYGKLGGEDGESGLSYKIEGENISFCMGSLVLMGGQSNNGVLRVSMMDSYSYYCKEGKTPDDFNKKGAIDYLRIILSPGSKLMGKILYD